ncbi:39S ribosomal protein L22, mitochondrial-like [Amphibalanus amphitrite]|uniref:39S ribosomal protein L22, mitochondrial-like n=1 Tax=Amphibalanus amphitrite TaxID=1232801 RepID=UPI001C901C10|nr:39S ribosomal protein L22, mitochondrial-like [Amphibalanus amphitrite]
MLSARILQRIFATNAAWPGGITAAAATLLPSRGPSSVSELGPARPAGVRAMSFLPPTGPRRWPLYNEQVFPPTGADEAPRPAFVCHVKTNVKYSTKKMWYIASMIRGMSIEEALKQLQFVNKKGAQIVSEALKEAQEMAVRDHNVEFKNNLWVAESFATKGRVLKGLRRHARARPGIVHYRYTHYFVRLEEGAPPEQYYADAPLPPEEMLKRWLEQRRQRTITHSL